MSRKLSFIFFLGLIQGPLWSDSLDSDKVPVHPVSLEVFDGEGSLLLNWTIRDTIKVKEIRIYKRNSQDEDFDLISTLGTDSDRFLDNNC